MSIKTAARVAACFVMAASFSLALAQQTTPQSTEPPAQNQAQGQAAGQDQAKPPASPSVESPEQQKKDEQSNSSGTSKDRLFYALPNFLTLENVGKVPPLTTKQKFGVVTRGSFDPVQYFWYGFLTAIGQAEDSEPGYGQGWGAFGKRYATNFADGTIENYMTGAILPSVLHQDPRYFELGKGSFMHRTWYAMSRNLITRTDSGKNQFNYSEVVGGALAASISTYSYHPRSHLFTTTTPGVYKFIPSDRTLSNTAKVWGTQYGYDTLTLVIKEFWPDIRRKIKHDHHPITPVSETSAH